MKTRKIRLLSALLALAMLLALLPTAAFAEDNHNCGATSEDNVTWSLENGTLTISGTGAMADYVVGRDQPWYGQKGNIKKFVVENGVTTIGNTAFSGHTKLTEVDMSNATSLEKIGQYAFESCTGVKTIDLSNATYLEKIGNNAFLNCSQLKNVDLSNAANLKEIGGNAFKSSGVENVTFPQNSQLTEIGNEVFAHCSNLKNIKIPETVTKIGNFAFEQTKLTSIIIPASVTDIGILAFGECKNLKTVTFADDSQLKKIWTRAFAGTPITSIEIPASVTNIGTGAFEQCEQLESVTFAPDSKLEAIVGDAFSGCSALKTISCDGNVKQKLLDAKVIDENKTQIKTYPPAPAPEPETPEPETPEPETYPITIDYGTAYDAEHNVITKAAKGETVYVEASETALEGMAFERWEVRKGDVKLENDRAAKTSFTMPDGMVQLEAMYQTKAAEVHDSGWDAATVVTGVAVGTGTAILAYHIGMEVYAEQVLGKDVAVPRTRAEVALLAWQLAGSPAVNGEGEPLSEAAQAQRWAVESGLMQPDAEGNFNGTKKMSKWNALRTLDAAKKMG